MEEIETSETSPIVQLADVSEPVNPVIAFDMPVAPPPPAPAFDKTKLILPASILIAAFLVSGTILYSRGAPSQQNAVINQGTVTVKQVDIDLSNAPSMGNPNAPITIVEFGDFQCPFCQRYAQNNQPSFISEYVNSGKARFVWKDYAFLGPESNWSSEAARCANDQGKFWQYHDYLYSHQGQENSGAFSKSNLKKFAQVLGLNTTDFNNCLDSGKYTAFIQEETQTASTYGVAGTPATFVNGLLVTTSDGNSVGAAPFSVFKAVIDKDLSK